MPICVRCNRFDQNGICDVTVFLNIALFIPVYGRGATDGSSKANNDP